jgi:Zn-dependent protease with chaperone function
VALVPGSEDLLLRVNHTLGTAARWVSGIFHAHTPSPEAALLSSPLRDARLAPKVPMSHEQIDVGTLAQLSSIGLKRGKLVTSESHPELMAAWGSMAQRAGLARAPQLIIAESDTLNALTISKDEVAITTGLLKRLDLRQTVAVLGHELGHVRSDHVSSRVVATVGLAGAGMAAGNEFGRHGGVSTVSGKLAERFPKATPVLKWFGLNPQGRASSALGYAAYIGAGAVAGSVLANQLTVRPTELDADRKGAHISADPQGLASALEVLQQSASKKTLLGTLTHLRSGYPSVQARIDQLRQMGSAEAPVLAQVLTPKPAPAAATTPQSQVQQVALAERVGAPVQGPALA